MSTGELLADFYSAVRARLSATILGLDAGELATAVPACPGWTVKDTFGHVVSNPIDGLAGRLSGGPPSEEFTAEQVERWRDVPVGEMVEAWNGAGAIDDVIRSVGSGIAPIVIDAYTHEVDILGALGRPVDTTAPFVAWVGERFRDGRGDTPASDFEVFRARLGRRSRAQVAAWSWTSPPDLDSFFIFGPRADDLDI